MTAPLENRCVLLTGAGTGVGRHFAIGLARDGARVVGLARTAADLEETARLCPPGSFEAVVGDVARAEDVEAAFVRAESRFGPVDIVVNNAAVYPKLDFLSQDPDDFARTMAINVVGVARTCHRALPGMLQRGYGRVVNVGSYAFLDPIPRAAAYSASKGAVSSLTRAIAAEIDGARYPDVRVNELMPGIFRTRMTEDQGEDPSVAYAYLRPVLTIAAGGPHGEIFLKGQLQPRAIGGGGGGVRGRVKRLVNRALAKAGVGELVKL
jgi:NAD(P)-dependent dehydrogenase (short-subunit alcohol dehydrogenase family)